MRREYVLSEHQLDDFGLLVQSWMERINSFGRNEDGGYTRPLGSKALSDCQRSLEEALQSVGFQTWIDGADNVHAVLPFGKRGAREILVGSHIDTVIEGGMFDGALGVAAGIAAALFLQKNEIQLQKNIHIVATNGEEGNELGGTFGSRAMAGVLPLDDPEFLKKAKKYGYDREKLEASRYDFSKTAAYLELHIEQGPTLWKSNEDIGVVTGLVGLRRYAVFVHGLQNHAGTTMMEDRKDALVEAAHLVLLADQLARETGHHFVATVGKLDVTPNLPPVVPGKVDMVLEMRSESEERMDEFYQAFLERGKRLADFSAEPIVKKAPSLCNRDLIETIERVCKEENLNYRKMPSGATHDGTAISTKVPFGMIFVPSIRGISHAKEEQTDWEQVEKGSRVLLRTAADLAKEA